MTYKVTGQADMRRLADALLQAGDADLKKRIAKSLRDAGKPLAQQIRAEGVEHLPSKGGLRAKVAKYPVGISTTMTRRNASVTIRLPKRRGYDRGFVRHPVFGNREKWVNQKVHAHGFTDAFEAHADEVADAVNDAVQQALNEVARKA